MAHDPLLAYLRDHLAGARVALEMLHHLEIHTADPRLRSAAASFYAEVEADYDLVDQLTRRLGSEISVLREASARLLERLGRLKATAGTRSSALAELEAVETLSLCFVGKMAMWDALMAIAAEDPSFPQVNYDGLRNRAQDQYRRMEAQRIRLVRTLLVPSPLELALERNRISGPVRLTRSTRLAVAARA
jgi:hypothetical protein